jgi:hypothetical protein
LILKLVEGPSFWCWLLHRHRECFVLSEKTDGEYCEKCEQVWTTWRFTP